MSLVDQNHNKMKTAVWKTLCLLTALATIHRRTNRKRARVKVNLRNELLYFNRWRRQNIDVQFNGIYHCVPTFKASRVRN